MKILRDPFPQSNPDRAPWICQGCGCELPDWSGVCELCRLERRAERLARQRQLEEEAMLDLDELETALRRPDAEDDGRAA